MLQLICIVTVMSCYYSIHCKLPWFTNTHASYIDTTNRNKQQKQQQQKRGTSQTLLVIVCAGLQTQALQATEVRECSNKND